jgi:hypothetical protein
MAILASGVSETPEPARTHEKELRAEFVFQTT